MRCGGTTVASAFCVFAHFVLRTFCEPRVSEGCAGGSCVALQRSHLQLDMDNLRAHRVMEDDEGKSIAQHGVDKKWRDGLFKFILPGNGCCQHDGCCQFDGMKTVQHGVDNNGRVIWTKKSVQTLL